MMYFMLKPVVHTELKKFLQQVINYAWTTKIVVCSYYKYIIFSLSISFELIMNKSQFIK